MHDPDDGQTRFWRDLLIFSVDGPRRSHIISQNPTTLPIKSCSLNHTIMTFSNKNYKEVHQQDDLEDSPVMVHRPVVEVVSGGDDDMNHNNGNDPSRPSSCWNTPRCAGCVGAMAGCFTMGPCLAVICATGCMYCAKTQHDNVGGDIARACGSMGVQANVMIRDLDDEHHVWERTQQAIASTWNRTKEWNDEYQISQKTKNCLVSTIKAGVEFNKEHKLVEHAAQGVGKVLSVVAKEVVHSSDSNTAASSAVEAFSDPEIYASDEENTNTGA
jgi:hypothetical protein